MTYTEHTVVKPEKLAATAMAVLEQNLTIPKLMRREGIDAYRGAKDDTVNVKVKGVLPFHTYAWRNDRSAGITYDVYSERSVPVTFGDDVYSATSITDEQAEMDLARWTDLLTPQAEAVARGVNRRAVDAVESASYEVVLGDAASDMKGQLFEARRVMNILHSGNQRTLLVGSNFEALLLDQDNLTLAQYAGNEQAGSVLHDAILGRLAGFNVVSDETINPNAAYAFGSEAFIFLNAAPRVPSSVKQGATSKFEGVALRWLTDYDMDHMVDRSVVNTWPGFRPVTDVLVGWDATNSKEYVSTGEHLVRAIKIVLDGASVYPPAGGDLAKAVGSAITAPGPQLSGAAATVAND